MQESTAVPIPSLFSSASRARDKSHVVSFQGYSIKVIPTSTIIRKIHTRVSMLSEKKTANSNR